MGLHTRLNVSKIHFQCAYKGPQFYTDSGKLCPHLIIQQTLFSKATEMMTIVIKPKIIYI